MPVKLVIGGTCGDVNVILSDVNGFILARDSDICRGVLVKKYRQKNREIASFIKLWELKVKDIMNA